MTIEEKTTYTATSLPGAPPRDTRAEAEADEARGVELAAFLAALPTLSKEQWARVASRGSSQDAARYAAWDAAQDAAWDAERGAAWDATLDASRDASRDAGTVWPAVWPAARAACAIVVRDLITPAQFNTLTAPMRAAEVNFGGLTNHNEQEQSDG